MNKKDHIHLNPKFLNDRKIPTIHVNPQCMQKESGPDTSKETSLGCSIQENTNFSYLPAFTKSESSSFNGSQSRIITIDDNFTSTSHNNLLKPPSSRYKLNRVLKNSVQNINKSTIKQISSPSHKSGTQFRKNSDSCTIILNKHKLVKSRNLQKPVANESILEKSIRSPFKLSGNRRLKCLSSHKLVRDPPKISNDQHKIENCIDQEYTTGNTKTVNNLSSKITTPPPSLSRKYVKKNPYVLRKTVLQTPSLRRLVPARKDMLYLNIYKRGKFVNKSFQQNQMLLKNQTSSNFKMISINGKLYHSNNTSLKRRSLSSSVVSDDVIGKSQKNTPSDKCWNNNDKKFKRSPPKPGALIELFRQRTAILRKKRSDLCSFYQRHGYCKNHQKKLCPFVHRNKSIPVCNRFLQGDCTVENCRFSHQRDKSKMAGCSYFVESLCTRENCPYQHVKVNPSAPVCKHFIAGTCKFGENCKQKHVYLCGDYQQNSSCPRGINCQLRHPKKRLRTSMRKVPSRDNSKSLQNHKSGHILGCTVKKDTPQSRKGNNDRYFYTDAKQRTEPDKVALLEEPNQIKCKLQSLKLPDKLPAFIPLQKN